MKSQEKAMARYISEKDICRMSDGEFKAIILHKALGNKFFKFVYTILK